MKSSHILIAIVCFVLGVVATLALSNRSQPLSQPANQPTSQPEEPKGEQVVLYNIGSVIEGTIELAEIAERVLEEEVTANGKVEPNANRVAQVGPLVSGRVTRLLVGEGRRVRAGQTLAIVESVNVAQAHAAYQQARERVKVANARLANVKKLAQAGVFTDKPVDEVRRERAQVASELAASRVEYQSETANAESAVKAAEAAYQRAESARKLAQAELERRRSLVEAGAVQYKPLEDAKREMADARAALITAQSALAAAESQKTRVEKLQELGTASKREVETAHAAHAEAAASVESAKSRVEIAQQTLAREQKIFDEKIYARRETESAESVLTQAEREAQEKQVVWEQSRKRLEIAQSPQKVAALREMENRLAALDALLKRETSVSQQNLLAAKEVQQAEADVAQARGEAQAAVNALRLFKVNPSIGSGQPVGIPIVAPIDGVVTERRVKVGETVDATTTMFTLMDLSRVWVELDVYEKDVPRVRLGQLVRLSTGQRVNGSMGQWTGRVTHIGSVVDEKKRTVKVRTEVTDHGFLKPNMFVTGSIVTGTGKSVLTVPREAIADEGGAGKAVYILWPDNKGWERHPVLVLGTDSRYAAIKGPAAGEKVATRGLALVQAAVKTQMAGGGGTAMAHTHEH
jgi:RND family efflux transporter MFP subunit